MMSTGGNVGAAEAAMRRWVKEGGPEDLELKGKPIDDRPPPPPYVDRAEDHLQHVVNRMHQEKTVTGSEWRDAVAKVSIQDIKASSGSKGASLSSKRRAQATQFLQSKLKPM